MSELDQLYSWVNDKDREPPGVAFVWDGPARRIAARIAELEQQCRRNAVPITDEFVTAVTCRIGSHPFYWGRDIAPEEVCSAIIAEFNLRAHGKEQQAAVPIAEGEQGVGCKDCGRPYDSGGFPDLIITKDAWHRISPTGDDGGLLCPSCICQRLHDAGMREVEGAFMSGPIKSVDQSLMHTIRWVENLREQGHGWSCPDCGSGREQLTPPPTK